MSRRWSRLALITLLAGGPACGSETYEEEPPPASSVIKASLLHLRLMGSSSSKPTRSCVERRSRTS